MNKKTAIINGAGPAGLTSAYELLKNSDITPIVFEMSDEYVGGISRTINYKGNRIDIGGHRFFSKSDTVMDWWKEILPLEGEPKAPNPEISDRVMLVRKRLSRIFFLRKFFDYPVSLSLQTIRNLGIFRIMKIGFSYTKVRLFPPKKIENLEDFFIDRFGKELYLTFFKDYTEKVWGVSCKKISAEWGAQRIKGLSIKKTIAHAFKSLFKKKSDLKQKDVETSLIGQFMYPKLGPGQLWEEVARIVKEKGGQLNMGKEVIGVNLDGGNISSIKIKDIKTGETEEIKGDYFFSTMPVKDLINSMGKKVPEHVKETANGLCYRDFITVGLLLNKLKVETPDNWIYIQERDVKIGRLQIFNNWSPYLVKDSNKTWIGLEYFCNEGDDLWSMKDEEFIKFATEELDKIDIIEKEEVVDSTIIRVPKTYPSYFGEYENFDKIRSFTDKIENLFLIGRNGMHRYNNQDHSMLTAIAAVNNIIEGKKDKSNIWNVNVEKEYHEEK